MIAGFITFFELGAIILAWNIFWNFLLRGFTAQHPDSPAIQGLAAISHA
ncbi:MAG: hypothetical protein ACRESO_05990 [Gammaproteobacteria bacterium]